MTARLAAIWRHPLKGHGREPLASVRLSAGECLPWDRHWAVAHDAARLEPGWNRCIHFARGAKAPALMALTSTLDEATGVLTLHHPDRGSHAFRPDDPADLAGFLAWATPLNPPGRAQPVGIVRAGRGMTDSTWPSVSILSTASLADLSARMGRDLSRDRWRGNLWLDGLAPWAEMDWVGRRFRLGGAVLQVREVITRCAATTVDPETGLVDADTLGALTALHDEALMGVYAEVVEGGLIALGDEGTLQ